MALKGQNHSDEEHIHECHGLTMGNVVTLNGKQEGVFGVMDQSVT